MTAIANKAESTNVNATFLSIAKEVIKKTPSIFI